jgi:hypothetical protein
LFFSGFIVFFFVFSTIQAQKISEISGTVKDQNGAVIAGVQVLLSSNQTKRTTNSNKNG